MRSEEKLKGVSRRKTARAAAPPAIEGGTSGVDPQAVATRAFGLFLERGARHGHDVEDWLQAEREIRAERGTVASAAPDATFKPPRRAG